VSLQCSVVDPNPDPDTSFIVAQGTNISTAIYDKKYNFFLCKFVIIKSMEPGIHNTDVKY
jgi:hypothetical protein